MTEERITDNNPVMRWMVSCEEQMDIGSLIF